MKYVVEITEISVKHVVVDAESSSDAEIIANNAYNNEEIILDYNNYLDTEFNVLRVADESDISEYENI